MLSHSLAVCVTSMAREMYSSFSFLSPAASGAGKSSTDGGLLFGAVPTGKGLVPLRKLDVSLVGVEFCGGAIGARKRMCSVAPGDCGVASHSLKLMNANDFDALKGSDTTEVIFIENQDGKSVFLSGHIPAGLIGNFSVYEDQKRSVGQWEEFLRGLQAASDGEISDSDKRSLFDHISGEGKPVETAKTPFKKRKVGDDASPQSLFGTSDAEAMLEDVALELPGPPDTMETLLKEWSPLVRNLTAVQGLIGSLRTMARENKTSVEEEFKKIDFDLAGVGNLLGRKPAGMGAGTAFELIDALERKMEEGPIAEEHSAALKQLEKFLEDADPDATLKSLVGHISKKTLSDAQVEALRRSEVFLQGNDPNKSMVHILQDFERVLSPLWKVLQGLSSDPFSTPGDRLAPLNSLFNQWPSSGLGGSADVFLWMQGAQRRIVQLESSLQQSQVPSPSSTGMGAGANAGVSFGATGSNIGGAGQYASFGGRSSGAGVSHGTMPARGTATSVDTVSMADFLALKQDVDDMKAQAQSESVTVEGEVFKSFDSVKAWLLLKAATNSAHVSFVDAPGLLAMVYAPQSSALDHVKLNSSALAGQYKTSADAMLDFSLTLELPQFFGKDSSTNALSQDQRVLPAIQDYEVWNGIGGVGGARKQLASLLQNDMQSFRELADVSLGDPVARLVASQMMTESREFLLSLSHWMSDYYVQLIEKGHKPKAGWELISRAVRAIFKELAKARMCGRGHAINDGQREPAQMWACLQGLRVQREFLNTGFGAHTSVIAILHNYLLDTSVTKEAHRESMVQVMKDVNLIVGRKNKKNNDV